MNFRQLADLMSDSEYYAYRASKALTLRHSLMARARIHTDYGFRDAARICVEEAREANHEYLHNAIQYRAQKDLEAQRREDYRHTLRQY